LDLYLKPYDNLFWDFNNGSNKRRVEEWNNYKKKVATYVASSQGQGTHFARTKIVVNLFAWRLQK
jgi:hypothetical protein